MNNHHSWQSLVPIAGLSQRIDMTLCLASDCDPLGTEMSMAGALVDSALSFSMLMQGLIQVQKVNLASVL